MAPLAQGLNHAATPSGTTPKGAATGANRTCAGRLDPVIRALAYLLAALVLLAVAELWVIGAVIGAVGFLPTIVLLLTVGAAGTIAVRKAGTRLLGRISSDLSRGAAPGDLLADGAFLVVAGVLLVFPGFITDVVALSLLLPFVRRAIRRPIEARLSRTVTVASTRVDVGRAWIDTDGHDSNRSPGDVRSVRGELSGGTT